MEKRFTIRWRELGSPTEPGYYSFAEGKRVRVRQHNIYAAEGNPDAICVIMCGNPLAEDPKYALGSIDPDPPD
jgi:hypothetical protein